MKCTHTTRCRTNFFSLPPPKKNQKKKKKLRRSVCRCLIYSGIPHGFARVLSFANLAGLRGMCSFTETFLPCRSTTPFPTESLCSVTALVMVSCTPWQGTKSNSSLNVLLCLVRATYRAWLWWWYRRGLTPGYSHHRLVALNCKPYYCTIH